LTAEQAETRVPNTTAHGGRTGALTPVADLEPVRVSGVIVRHATLHNEDEMRRKDVRIGDHVVVQRAGEVMPEIVRVLPEKRTVEGRRFETPAVCPVSGSPVERRAGEAVSRCTGGASCPAQVLERLIHFGSRDALDIEGVGPKLLQQMLDRDLMREPADLFTLTKEHVLTRERMEDRQPDIADTVIHLCSRTEESRCICALGQRRVDAD